MKRVYAILLCITILFAVSVEADAYYNDDLFKEDIKIEDDFKEKEEEEYINETKSATNIPYASWLYFDFNGYRYKSYVSNMSNKTKYFFKFITNNEEYIVCNENRTSFIRGSEPSAKYMQGYCYDSSNNYTLITIMGESSMPSYGTVISYITGDVPEYVEPTTEPTPEPTPDPTPDPTPNPTPTPDNPSVSEDNITVSWNSVSENLISIEEQIRRLRQDVQQLRNTTFSVSISSVPDIGDDASVSNNIISKPLSEYSTSESIALITLMLAFSALIVYIIHKSIYKWKR